MSDELSERDRGILAFERDHTRHSGAKEEAIRTELGLSPARYYQLLARIIETEAALRWDPQLVYRLQRIQRGEGLTR